MTTTKNLTIKNTVLATIAVAGLVAGTAACGGKNTDTTNDSMIDDTNRTATVEFDDSPIAIPVDDDIDTLDITFPDTSATDPADTTLPADTESPDAEISPVEDSPELVTPEDEAAPDDDTASTPEEEVEPDDGESTPDFDFDFDIDIDLPAVTMPTLTVTPEIAGAMVFKTFATYRMTIVIEENSTLPLADIETVTVAYPSRLPWSSTKMASLSSADDDSSIWTVTGLPVSEGDTLTITATNRMGQSDTMEVVVSLSAPL